MAPRPRYELRRRLDAVETTVLTGAPVAAGEVEGALLELAESVDATSVEHVRAVAAVAAGAADRHEHLARWGVAGIRRFSSASGAIVYRIPIETFPDHVNNVHLVSHGGRSTLHDCGSQMPMAREELTRAAMLLAQVFGEARGLDSVDDVVISHGHIDHFGGAAQWQRRGVPIHVHEFDARVVTSFEERIVVTALALRVFLDRAGVAPALRTELEQMYVFTKQLFSSVPVDRVLVDGDTVNGLTVHHTPGHCPGQICLQVDDILLTADHVLPRITPHQSPESITPWTGLDHYLQSLDRIAQLPGIRLALPGHEEPIDDMYGRIAEIKAFHHRRLGEVLERCRAAVTVSELSHAMFGEPRGYGQLLALEEAAAHVEYLARRGRLEIANVEELMGAANAPVRYRVVDAGQPADA